MLFDRVDWNRVLREGFFRAFFNRIWDTQISLFSFYTAYNAPAIYQSKRGHSSALTCPQALGVRLQPSSLFLRPLQSFRTSHNLEEQQYISLHPSVTFYPGHLSPYDRSYLLHHIVENQPGGGGSIALVLNIARFFVSIGATLLFGIMSSNRMFGNQVTSKSRKYLASHTFTASYPILHFQARLGVPFYGFLYSTHTTVVQLCWAMEPTLEAHVHHVKKRLQSGQEVPSNLVRYVLQGTKYYLEQRTLPRHSLKTTSRRIAQRAWKAIRDPGAVFVTEVLKVEDWRDSGWRRPTGDVS